MTDFESRRQLLKGAGFLAGATVLFASWMGWGIGGEASVRYVDDLATMLAALTATLLCFGAGARHAGELRRFWWVLAAACGAWTLAESIWAVSELALRVSVPVPSWADVGYLAGSALAVSALGCPSRSSCLDRCLRTDRARAGATRAPGLGPGRAGKRPKSRPRRSAMNSVRVTVECDNRCHQPRRVSAAQRNSSGLRPTASM
jgi:hypothetical protein